MYIYKGHIYDFNFQLPKCPKPSWPTIFVLFSFQDIVHPSNIFNIRYFLHNAKKNIFQGVLKQGQTEKFLGARINIEKK